MRSVTMAGAALFALAMTMSVAEADSIQISQPGDGAMSCVQLATEVGRMDQIVSGAEKAKSNAESNGRMANVAGSVATNAAVYSGVLGSVPGLGFFGSAVEGAVKADAEAEAKQQAQTVQNAQMRRVSLMGIYQGKGCMNAPAPLAPAQSATAVQGGPPASASEAVAPAGPAPAPMADATTE